MKQGMLYLCATPIGNLSDITAHVLDTLREADLIAAEDTRNSIKLLNRFEIKTPMTSYHEYNKYDKAKDLIRQMGEGKNIALITDAGTPAISDPGEVLVRMCYEEGITVTSLPGACACITALTLSGLNTRRFCFEGFLPTDKKEKKAVLEELTRETRTMIIYEAPHHLIKTMEELMASIGDRTITICRELTKKYETVFRTTFSEAITYYKATEPKGECVIVIEGKSRDELADESISEWNRLSIEEHMAYYEEQGIERKEAMKMVAKDRGVTKREIYQSLLDEAE
ncbi:MAG TPA: 16S rRNA (cytidine(1402)-2'-O)-methyltransferase [Lachnospiraceae bacterium]|jgi:16S rRNA (cytidine1402-2'-O)-methyltransferase|nr:16S rRNA (cytidine(1402)-2'-O)-methyltransferase [Lachnospiraceae bacterium]